MPNPGSGAWAFVAISQDRIIAKRSGFERSTTNNRMEMMAIMKAMSHAIENTFSSVVIYTDSKLCKSTIESWYYNWEALGWEHGKNKKKKNLDLIHEAMRLKHQIEQVRFEWVKGHSGNRFNDMVDGLCSKAISDGNFSQLTKILSSYR